MNEITEFWVQIGSIVSVGIVIFSAILSLNKSQSKANKFVMKMLFGIFDVLECGKVNGQVKELRKEAEHFNIDN